MKKHKLYIRITQEFAIKNRSKKYSPCVTFQK